MTGQRAAERVEHSIRIVSPEINGVDTELCSELPTSALAAGLLPGRTATLRPAPVSGSRAGTLAQLLPEAVAIWGCGSTPPPDPTMAAHPGRQPRKCCSQWHW
ncbi:hypothetical protein MMUR_08270 [Mycolicibacterium murale]|uniref:Uncharacterized protein n=1 Tax=Mycolicibacterium murale TaxID=182220 RepID=A0A7I9WG18_9MYCO|nr:hypothetical protein MMUR_08270 [Mycolicibacterium murale]